MRLFLAGTSFVPSYGGPAVSVARLGTALAAEGVEVGLWAHDGSAALDGTAGPGVQPLVGPLESAIAQFGTVDVFHDSGLWLPHNHRISVVAHRRRVARIVSPRGMLEPWALRHKHWKKRVAWLAYQRRDLRLADTLHAATEMEARQLSALDLGVALAVVPNGVDIPVPISHLPRPDGKRVVAFLGRIYPVKGLTMLIEAWSVVRPRNWVLRIAGPDEAGHMKSVQVAVKNAGLSDVVEFLGAVGDAGKRDLFTSADLLVLPSHSESFGMVIGEALANGVPVLTTTAVPWPDLEASECGWRVNPTVDGVCGGLERATNLSSDVLRGMGRKGKDLVARSYQWSSIAVQMKIVYEGIMH